MPTPLHAYPRKFEFSATLPKTPSGKVQHFSCCGSTVQDHAVIHGDTVYLAGIQQN
jgi:hypothetical protein